jgi:hypothetical protein
MVRGWVADGGGEDSMPEDEAEVASLSWLHEKEA